MKSPVILFPKFLKDCRRKSLEFHTKEFLENYDRLRREKEIVLEQDLKYRLSCIIDKLGLLENQEKLDAELDSKN